MKKRIVTIGREFGSGGRSVGRMVAQKLGVSFYDKELVRQISLKTGFHEDFIEQGEYAPIQSWMAYAFPASGVRNVMQGMSAEDFLWCMQCRVIRELAEREPCVIVGRCADYILRERMDCLNAFIHADMASRADRVVRLYGQAETSIERRLEDKDKKRRVYYKHYTGQEWGAAANYDVSLSTSALGLERCADIIVSLMQEELPEAGEIKGGAYDASN